MRDRVQSLASVAACLAAWVFVLAALPPLLLWLAVNEEVRKP